MKSVTMHSPDWNYISDLLQMSCLLKPSTFSSNSIKLFRVSAHDEDTQICTDPPFASHLKEFQTFSTKNNF